VLVVDDSRFMVGVVTSLLEKVPDLQVIGYALDGQDAVDKAHALRPDVIIMDVVMPRMSGIEATRRIARPLGIPIIILSAYTQEGARLTLEALEAGAVDCIAKPEGERSFSLGSAAELLVEKVRGVADRAADAPAVDTAEPGATGAAPGPVGPLAEAGQPGAAPSLATARPRPAAPAVVAIGASSGGIAALSALLPRFSPAVPYSILVIQHFPERFTQQLAARLASLCTIPVREAVAGERLTRATALVAPGGTNLEVTPGWRIRLSQGEGPAVMRPSIDVAFRSVAKVFGTAAVAVVLSGMGRDGTAGAREVHAAGGLVLVQDWRSAAAPGMPRAALDAGVADAMLPVDRIAAYLTKG
jgi:two-component system chemotaxis response regulator CheB